MDSAIQRLNNRDLFAQYVFVFISFDFHCCLVRGISSLLICEVLQSYESIVMNPETP